MLSTLVGEATQVKDRVWHGVVFCQNGHKKAYIKILSTRKLLVECVAAIVGRAHDLPIPAPHLVRVSGALLPGFETPDFQGWAFGCEDSETPSLSRLTRDSEEVTRRIRSWKRAIEAGAFDSWIGNQDRTSKNLLWSDDSSKINLIDHDDAFPDWLDPGGECHNEIIRVLCEGCDELSRRRHHKSALKSTEHYGKTDWRSESTSTAWAKLFTDEEYLIVLIAFLAERLQHLPALIASASGANQAEMRYAT